MPGDDDTAQTNIGVIVSRLNRLEHDHAELGVDFSKLHERLNYLERDKSSRAELEARYQALIEKHEELRTSHEIDSKKLSVVSDRLSWITLLLAALTLVASGISAYIGQLP